MRLGDLDALRDEVDTWGCNDYDKYDFLEAIDNAPTVTPDKIQAIMSEYLVYRCEPQRPQGEWVYDSDHSITIDMYKCSVCGGYGHTYFKFCPNCGAEMKGGAE